MPDHDGMEETTEGAKMDVRCCEHGSVWFDIYKDGVCITSIGFTAEEAMLVSDGLMEELEKAIAIRTAMAGPVGRA